MLISPRYKVHLKLQRRRKLEIKITFLVPSQVDVIHSLNGYLSVYAGINSLWPN